MIPSVSGFLQQDFEITPQPSLTHKMEFENCRVRGVWDEKEAMKQLIYKIILTERYKYCIYSWNFGIELEDLFNMPISFVIPEVSRRISEALTQDKRITGVENFSFVIGKSELLVKFTAHTIFGDIHSERMVRLGV
jgi:hypothetical protein